MHCSCWIECIFQTMYSLKNERGPSDNKNLTRKMAFSGDFSFSFSICHQFYNIKPTYYSETGIFRFRIGSGSAQDQLSSGSAQAQALTFLDFAWSKRIRIRSTPHSAKLATLNLITSYLKTCEKNKKNLTQGKQLIQNILLNYYFVFYW